MDFHTILAMRHQFPCVVTVDIGGGIREIDITPTPETILIETGIIMGIATAVGMDEMVMEVDTGEAGIIVGQDGTTMRIHIPIIITIVMDIFIIQTIIFLVMKVIHIVIMERSMLLIITMMS